MNIKYLIPIFALIMMLSPIWAKPICWESITCSHRLDATITDDGHSEYCKISRINIEGSSSGQVIIEIISPNLYGADAYHWFIINGTSPYINGNYPFLVGGMSSPVYVVCSDYTTPTVGDYTSGKGHLINRWTSADSEQEILVDATNLVSGALTNTLAVDDTNVTKSYENLSATTDNPFILGLAWLLFTFGIFLSFTFVFQLFKRR